MRTHVHHQNSFHNVFGGCSPVLTVFSGDSIETSIVDAHGFDGNLREVALRGNPLTGPFYIENAEPGDTIAVRIDSIYPNRRHAWSSTVVSHTVVESTFVPSLPEKEYATWDIDLEAGTLQVREPESALGRMKFQLAPMLGCIGVAPRQRQVLSSATSAEHGGNMDYCGVKKGATLYFPVFEHGALLSIGDGHALQGDGELGGTGIEGSFDVRLTVRLIKDKIIGWPRGEDEQTIFTLGNARPFFEAVQHATTEMLRWLLDGFGLDMVAVSILMGQCARIDVGNVFDPAHTAVCRISKSVIPGKTGYFSDSALR
jgi:amidase